MTEGGDFVWVPREPTEEMVIAGQIAIPGGHGQAWVFAANAYRAMLSAAPQAPETGWQGIESAPRDGTQFMAGCWPGREVIRLVSFIYPDDRLPVEGVGGRLWPSEPTHWMPLPVPPTQAGRASDAEEG